jgi:radical SAM superfamily enzyme YgiQ (UPF0313 family)
LSLIYAAAESRRRGHRIRIIDQRLSSGNWNSVLDGVVADRPKVVGFSVMTGHPITHALESSRYLKKRAPEIRIIWGGIHPTIQPESTLSDPAIDMLVMGDGNIPLAELLDELARPTPRLERIQGLAFKSPDGRMTFNPVDYMHRFIPYEELPYDLVDVPRYGRFGNDERTFTIFTSFGCPHRCTFCYSPILYRKRKPGRWVPYEIDQVLAHLRILKEKFHVTYLSVADEDFFVDLGRCRELFKLVADSGLRFNWGFRGTRIDELDRMDDGFLALLAEIGATHLHIGVESGSPRMLELMKKDITLEQIHAVADKLARHPRLLPTYNFFLGAPTETAADRRATGDLIHRLATGNPSAVISTVGQYVPYPGAELFDLAIKEGLRPPTNLEEWSRIDTHFTDHPLPWLDRRAQSEVRAVQMAALFCDRKLQTELGRGPLNALIKAAALALRPVARWRLRAHAYGFPFEYYLVRFGTRLIELYQRGIAK